MKLKFDHMIHYVDQLKGFKYPGELLKFILEASIINMALSIV